jgi:hypothetical protein
MKKPSNNEENVARCICGNCALYIGRVCKEETDFPVEKPYCARVISDCKMGGGTCLCSGCEVYKENNLVSIGFCVKEIEESEPMADVV